MAEDPERISQALGRLRPGMVCVDIDLEQLQIVVLGAENETIFQFQRQICFPIPVFSLLFSYFQVGQSLGKTE